MVVVFWYFCILFNLYFVPFVPFLFCCICILLHLYYDNLYFVLLYFVLFVFWNFCILSYCILFRLVAFCSVCIMEYLYFDWASECNYTVRATVVSEICTILKGGNQNPFLGKSHPNHRNSNTILFSVGHTSACASIL